MKHHFHTEGTKPRRLFLARSLFRAAVAAACLGVVTLIPTQASAQTANYPAQTAAGEFVRGQQHWSASRSHFVVLNPDGNLVIARADGGYVWGFDSQPNIDHRHVGRVVWQQDGNLAAYDANGGYLWSALTRDPDPNASLILQDNGALQIVSNQRGVMWSSDGNLSVPAQTAFVAAPPPPPPSAQTANYPAQTAAGEFARGQQHWSASRSHFVVLNPDGNLVVARADGGYVWGFDTQTNFDHRHVGRVVWQQDGNLAAYDANGGYLWSALTRDPDPNASLILQDNGALQIVSNQRGVMWSSDGNLSVPAQTAFIAAPPPPPAPVMTPPPAPPVVAAPPVVTQPAAPLPAAGGMTSGFPITAGQTLARGAELASSSGNHLLILQNGGNLVINKRKDKQFVWGFNKIQGLSFQQVDRIAVQADGNFVALNAKGDVIWKALASNPDPSARLELSYGGALQLVSPGRGILWSSDGVLTQPIRVDSRQGNLRACQPEAGYSKCVQMANPTITIMGTARVTDKAMTVVANVYTEVFARLKPAFPANKFDVFRVYLTNGDAERELAVLPWVRTIGKDGWGAGSRAFQLGAGGPDALWIDEQMICKDGVASRNAAFAARLTNEADNTPRTFDQVIHEMAHSIDSNYNLLNTRLKSAYPGNPIEPFAQGVQAWFSSPSKDFSASETVLMNELFTSRAVFSCEGVTP